MAETPYLVDSNILLRWIKPPLRRRCYATGDYSLRLSGAGVGSAKFHFHLMFFPAACFLSGEGFSVVAVVAWIAAIERRFVNLFPYPSFS